MKLEAKKRELMKNTTPYILISICLLTSFNLCAQDVPLWLRSPAISPDGNTILFNYQGDIYKVPSAGGQAIPLTISESYEYSAVWSHDGQHVAFASNRYGNFDVFTVPVSGGEAKRLTFHSSNEKPSDFSRDNKSIIFTANRQDLHTNVQYPSGVMTELYSVPVNGGRVNQILTSPAHDSRYSSNGEMLIFHDRKGYENEWRKHHKSSVTRDIWFYNLTSKKYTQLSEFEGEDRNPVFAGDNDSFYYLSEQNGSFNVFKSSLSNSKTSIAITEFEKHPVRFLTRSNNGIICFSYHGEIYTMTENNPPVKLNLTMGYDGRQNLDEIVKVNKDFTESSLSPNGKEFVYVYRGEIFVSSIEHGTTKRITDTPWQERSASFSSDGKSILYAAEVNDSWNLYKTSIVREEEKYFFQSTALKQQTLLATKAEEFQPTFSPDGKEVAYLEDRTTLKVLNLKTKKTRTVLPAEHNYSYSDGDMYYQWSPDSQWFLVSYGPKENVQLLEVGLIEASGTGTLRNLTQSGYYDFMPKWAMDGKSMIWGTNRLGNKAENNYGFEIDIYALFFSQKEFDRFNLSKEEYALIKEAEEEKKKKEEEAEKNKKDKKKDKKLAEKKPDPISIDWKNLLERKKRLTIHTAQSYQWVLSKDSDVLYYATQFEGKNNIWSTDLRTKETKQFAAIGANIQNMEIDKKGEFIFILAEGKAMKVDIKDGAVKGINTNGEMLVKKSDERSYMFEHSWRQVREKFYLQNLHEVDWDYYKQAYQPFLKDINNNHDFAEMLSEMLGELNASHTGSSYRTNDETSDATASLGLLYDYSHEGDGIRIAEVLINGPSDKSSSKIQSGTVLEKIDGTKITPEIDFYQLLNRKVGKNVLLTLSNPKDSKQWQEVVKPISLRDENQLLYKRWVDTRRKNVEELSNGKLGYVHVRSMNDSSMRTVFEDALGKHIGAEALIVDTRFNGGGNLHDALSDFLTGEKYMDIIPHGQNIGQQPWNKWTKPSIVIMGESNYSDAHLFPVAYKMKEGGKNLGMPVPGTGTFVWWERQIDPTITFGIPMGGWRPVGDDNFLENSQLEPDIKVNNEPEMMAVGRDQQLEEAVKELMR